MVFNIHTGEFEVKANFRLFSGMKRNDLFSQRDSWESWIEVHGQVTAYRTVFSNREINDQDDLYLIVFFKPNDGSLTEWDIQPIAKFSGSQKHLEGPYTKIARIWFERRCGVLLPVKGAWGNIDAAYDVHNQTTLIICNYCINTAIDQ